MLAQAAGGLFSLTGDADGPPVRPGGTFGDTATGAHTAMAILAAYVQQPAHRRGPGDRDEHARGDDDVHPHDRRRAVGTLDAEAAKRIGNRLGGAPTDMYRCAPFGANDYVYVMVGTPRMWEALCKVIDRLDLLDDAALRDTPPAAHEHEALLHEIIADVVRRPDQARGDDPCCPTPASPRRR